MYNPGLAWRNQSDETGLQDCQGSPIPSVIAESFRHRNCGILAEVSKTRLITWSPVAKASQ